jgi:hypothetical protein
MQARRKPIPETISEATSVNRLVDRGRSPSGPIKKRSLGGIQEDDFDMTSKAMWRLDRFWNDHNQYKT